MASHGAVFFGTVLLCNIIGALHICMMWMHQTKIHELIFPAPRRSKWCEQDFELLLVFSTNNASSSEAACATLNLYLHMALGQHQVADKPPSVEQCWTISICTILARMDMTILLSTKKRVKPPFVVSYMTCIGKGWHFACRHDIFHANNQPAWSVPPALWTLISWSLPKLMWKFW